MVPSSIATNVSRQRECHGINFTAVVMDCGTDSDSDYAIGLALLENPSSIPVV